MITLHRTKSMGLVASIMRHPRLYPSLTGESPVPPEDFQPNSDPNIHYMVAMQKGEILGLFITHPLNPVCWEMHHAILPKAWGPTADLIGEAFERWIFTETDCQVVIGFTPLHNLPACKYARRRDMREVGRIPHGSRKNGKLYDMIVFSKTKGQSTLV